MNKPMITTIALTAALAVSATAFAGGASNADPEPTAQTPGLDFAVAVETASLGTIVLGPVIGTVIESTSPLPAWTVVEDRRFAGESAIDAFCADSRINALANIVIEDDYQVFVGDLVGALERGFTGGYDVRALAFEQGGVRAVTSEAAGYPMFDSVVDEAAGEAELVRPEDLLLALQDLESQDKVGIFGDSGARITLGFEVGCDAPPYLVTVDMFRVEIDGVASGVFDISVFADNTICSD